MNKSNSIREIDKTDLSEQTKFRLDKISKIENINNEIERQKALENELHCVFIRINPDEKDFKLFKEINKTHRHIKKFLIDKI